MGDRHVTLTEALWIRFSDIYGSAFTSQFSEMPTQIWDMALDGMTPSMISKGLSKMIADPRFETFPPKPPQFRRLCLPAAEDLGLPGDEQAFRQAVGIDSTKHPAVIYALRTIDSHRLRTESAAVARAMFAAAWAKTIEHVSAGGALPAPEKQITEQAIKANPDEVRDSLTALRRIAGLV